MCEKPHNFILLTVQSVSLLLQGFYYTIKKSEDDKVRYFIYHQRRNSQEIARGPVMQKSLKMMHSV